MSEKEVAEPQKDKHGCVIGKEIWDEELRKCMPIPAEETPAFTEASAIYPEEKLHPAQRKQKTAI